MNFVKALIPGTALTVTVAGIIGSNHSKGAWLMIEHMTVSDHSFYWSWPLSVAATFLSWVLFTITPK
jgi:hypothetical protein